MIKQNLKIYLSILNCFVLFTFPIYSLAGANSYYKPSHAVLIVNANLNKVLYRKNANKKVNPASLTKMMTIYLAFEKIKQGKLSMESKLPISKYASSRPKSNINLKVGKTITLKEAILSLIVKSANDSAVVIAEAIAGTEKNFAKLMTERAKQLGMKNTTFTNASGWHHNKQKTTALDIAKLAIALRRDYSQYYHLFSRTSFYYKNRLFKGHNNVLLKLKGAEGMKTGYTSKAGWNLVTTAKRGRTRLIGVIIGDTSWQSRDKKMITMLNTYFKKINSVQKNRKVYASNKSKKIASTISNKYKTYKTA